MIPTLDLLQSHGLLQALDVHLARRLSAIAGETDPRVQLGLALACHAVADGSSCVALCDIDTTSVLQGRDGLPLADVAWPKLDDWRESLRRSPLVSHTETADTLPRPLVLDDADRLYLQRYWRHEHDVATAIRRWAEYGETLDDAWMQATLLRLFGASDGKVDGQKAAAVVAASQRFSVVTGGPGTGKTSTVVKLLALLIEREQQSGRPLPRIALMAPTGKAAARLAESVQKARDALDCPDEVRAAIPTEAATLHRSLGLGFARRGRDKDAPRLWVDIAVVDEASMIDLPMLDRLLQAMPEDGRLVLLGDEHQLASVDVGTILGDICYDARRGHSGGLARQIEKLTGAKVARVGKGKEAGLADNIVRLEHSYRFAPTSAIRRISEAMRVGAVDEVMQLLEARDQDEVIWVTDEPSAPLRERLLRHVESMAQAATPLEKLRAQGSFQVLCAHREGSRGVAGINRLVEQALQERGTGVDVEGDYDGRPILVERNDYDVDLYNGDLGLVTWDPDSRRRVAAFARGDGVRLVAPALLPEHGTVYAMTVHKSQGSEFDEVAVVLPEEPSRLLSRELLYTAMTRARRKVTLYASAAVLRAAIAQPVRRATGLHDLLWRQT